MFEDTLKFSIIQRFNNEKLCKMKDIQTEDTEDAFKDELNAIVADKNIGDFEESFDNRENDNAGYNYYYVLDK